MISEEGIIQFYVPTVFHGFNKDLMAVDKILKGFEGFLGGASSNFGCPLVFMILLRI